MTWAATAVAGSSLISGLAGSSASKAQRKSQDSANALQLGMFNQQMQAQEPWRQAGLTSLADLQGLMSDPNKIQDSSAYQFRLGEGQKALERNLAARGGTLGGGALRELTRYGQGMASDEFQNQFNRLASIAGLGQSATNAQTNYMGNYGQQGAEGLTSLGNIKASSYLGGAQAIAGGIGDYMNYNLMRDIYGSGDSGGGSSGGGMKAPRADTGY